MKKLVLNSSGEADTIKIATNIAVAMAMNPDAGDLLLVSGELGAGKSVLARAIIRHLAENPELEVPSPTYTLCHFYDLPVPVAHYDLYRLSSIEELEELGWEEQLTDGSAIMEWPERCFDILPENAVLVTINLSDNDQRTLSVEGEGKFMERIIRSVEIDEFLTDALRTSGGDEFSRKPLSADASARSYELITKPGGKLLLMNSPAMPDGPPVKDGKPYSQIAHLAETVDAFVAIAKLLKERNISAPELPAHDLDIGLILIEHLGDEGVLDDEGKPILKRYLMAAELLAELHQEPPIKQTVPLEAGHTHQIPKFDENAFLIEASLFADWYVPEFAGHHLGQADLEHFETIMRELHRVAAQQEQGLVLRDYHSPNLLWMPERQGCQRVGVIDFQDALIGPSTYDVASLAQDARVDIGQVFERRVVEHYVACRQRMAKPFDETAFHESYAIMAAQRATKILGIFVRLKKRDGKPEYMKHLPRIREYLNRSLMHERLTDYRQWLETVIKL